ncbi:MAG: hypothetical protein ACRDPY_22390 [Streptosporangiaceae bacterium]
MKIGDEITAARERAAQESYDERYGRLAEVRRFLEAEYQTAHRLAEDSTTSPRRKIFLEGKAEGLALAMAELPSPPPPSPGPSWSWDERAEGWVRA